MSNKAGTTSAPPQRGYGEAVKRQQGGHDPSGRGAPDERHGLGAQREDDFGGGPEGMGDARGPAMPQMHEEAEPPQGDETGEAVRRANAQGDNFKGSR